MTTVHSSRMIALEGANNVRDLGGLSARDGRTVATGRLFRADALHRLTDSDLRTLQPLGIGTILDLRSEQEIASTGVARLTESGSRHVHMALMGSNPATPEEDELPPTLVDLYLLMAKHRATHFVTTITFLADPSNQPAIFHCAAGKDRTGMTAALIYSILGVDREEIIADYVLTELARDRMLSELASSHDYQIAAARYPESYSRAEDTTIRTFLQTLDESYGSPLDWLLASGISDKSIDDLLTSMLV